MTFLNRIPVLVLCLVWAGLVLPSSTLAASSGYPSRHYFQISELFYWHQDSSVEFVPADEGLPTTLLPDRELEFDAGMGFSLLYGFRTDHFLNTELEFIYRSADLRQVNTPGGTFLSDGSVQSASFMFNIPFNIHTGTAITPYIGAGVGFSWQKGDIEDVGDGSVPASSGEETEIAYQILAGFAYRVSPRVELLLGYKFLGTPDVALGTTGLENRTHNLQFAIRLYMKADQKRKSRAMKARSSRKKMR